MFATYKVAANPGAHLQFSSNIKTIKFDACQTQTLFRLYSNYDYTSNTYGTNLAQEWCNASTAYTIDWSSYSGNTVYIYSQGANYDTTIKNLKITLK